MTDVLNSIPPNAPHIRPLGPRTAAGILNLQEWGGSQSTAIYIPFSYPGAVATTGMSGPYPLPRNYSGYVYMVTAGLGTADSGGYGLTLTFYLNAAAFTTLTIPAGQMLAIEQTPSSSAWPIPGTLTDIFQVAVTAYAGSTAKDLTASIRVF